MNFYKAMKFLLILLLKKFLKLWMLPPFPCPGTIPAPSELTAELLSVPLIWVRHDGIIPPLQLLYNGPHTVLR
jgi:hypothetical protein